MTQEEQLAIQAKAKRYDEAVEKLRSLHDNYDTVSTLIDIKEELENIFPELKESEDEKIIKQLIKFINDKVEQGSVNAEEFVKHKSWIAWLEKQGKNNMGISETTKQKLEDNLNKALEKETPESLNKFLDEQGSQILANSAKTCKDEQKPADTEKGAKGNEADLDEEADNYWGTLTSDVRNSIYLNDFYKIAKHFFELGINASNKAQKGE